MSIQARRASIWEHAALQGSRAADHSPSSILRLQGWRVKAMKGRWCRSPRHGSKTKMIEKSARSDGLGCAASTRRLQIRAADGAVPRIYLPVPLSGTKQSKSEGERRPRLTTVFESRKNPPIEHVREIPCVRFLSSMAIQDRFRLDGKNALMMGACPRRPRSCSCVSWKLVSRN